MPAQVLPVYPQSYTDLYKYVRLEFYGTGLNTWAKPPAQNPETFMQLLNVFSGYDVVRRRWGYGLFKALPHDTRQLAPSNNFTQRSIVASGTSAIDVFSEDASDTYALNLIPSPVHAYRITSGNITGSGSGITSAGLNIKYVDATGDGTTTLGSLTFSTGALSTGSLAAGGTFASGGSVSIGTNGSLGLVNQTIFTGSFTGTVTWAIATDGATQWHYVLSGPFSDGTTSGTLEVHIAPGAAFTGSSTAVTDHTVAYLNATIDAPRIVNSRDYTYFNYDASGATQYKWSGRRNYLTGTDNLTGAAVISHVTVGTRTASQVTVVGNNVANDGKFGYGYASPDLVPARAIQGKQVTYSVYMRITPSGTTPQTVTMNITTDFGTVATTNATITSNSTFARFSVTGTMPIWNISAGSANPDSAIYNIAFFVGGIPNTVSIDFKDAQLEINSAASGYQSITGLPSLALDGQGVTEWGIVPPQQAPSFVSSGAGNVTTVNGRTYFTVFANSKTGHVSAPSPAFVDGPRTNEAVTIAINSFPPITQQVDTVYLLATADGGDQTLLYLIDSSFGANITDDLSATALASQPVMGLIDDSGVPFGCFFNNPPPNGSAVIKHANRMAMINGLDIAFSKSIDECTTSTGRVAGNFEECWPPAWTVNISDKSETPRALLSDGILLYVGTERSIRTISGDSIFNFSVPQVLFNDTGVMGQDVWVRVYAEGQPVGSMWLTPDLKVMQSDFNTYRDVGQPIQDQLLTINTATVRANARATAITDGEYDLFLLAVPTGGNTDCDTIFCYNLRTSTWSKWQLPDKATALLYNVSSTGAIQKLFASSLASSTYQNLWQLDRSFTQDRTSVAVTSITSTVQTPWLALSDPRFRKQLNDLEALTAETGTMLVTVEAASTIADFASPNLIISGAPLTQGVLGQAWKVFLAGLPTKNKYYRFTFTTTGTQLEVLNGIICEFTQLQI